MTNAEKMVWAAAFGASMEEQTRGCNEHHGGHAVRAIHVARMAVEAFRDARTINVPAEVHEGLAADRAAALRSTLNLLHEMHEPDEEG